MYTTIQLDKSRNFRYGMKAIHQIEKELKTSVSKLDFDNLTMQDAATIIWAGLVHEDRDLTPDKVMDLIDQHSNITVAFEIMGEAFKASFGGSEKNVQGAAEKETTETSA